MIPLFKVREPHHIPTLLMQNLDVLIPKINQENAAKRKLNSTPIFFSFSMVLITSYFILDVLPLIFDMLDSNVPQWQDIVVRQLPVLMPHIDYVAFKKVILATLIVIC